MRRDHVGVGALVVLDALERALCVPLVHEDDRMSKVHGGRRVDHHCRVIERRRHQVDAVAPCGDPKHRRQHAHQRRHRLGVESAQLAADALRLARRTARVLHRRSGESVLGPGGRLTFREFVEGAKPFDRTVGCNPSVGGQTSHVGCLRCSFGKSVSRKERLRLAVFQDVRHLGSGEGVVDGRDVQTHLHGCHIDLKERGGVERHRRNYVAVLCAEGPKRM